MSRATVDLQSVRFLLGYGLIFFFQHVLTILLVTAVMFLVQLGIRADRAREYTPVLTPYRYSHVSHPLYRNMQQRLADVATVAEEDVVGVRVVEREVPPQESQLDKFSQRSEVVFTRSWRRTASARMYVPLISFIPLSTPRAPVLLAGGRQGRFRSASSSRSTST